MIRPNQQYVNRKAAAAVAPLMLMLCAAAWGQDAAPAGQALRWRALTSVPDPEGFAGAFAGVSNDALILAGGANFPDKRPWEEGTKVWYDSVFVLTEPDGQWVEAGKLPRPLAYGVSVTTEDGVVCIGGGDGERHYADVFVLRWDGERMLTEAMPSLPQPVAFSCGALLDHTIYVAGGVLESEGTAAATLHTFWALDLSAHASAWQELEAWPGPPRTLAVAGVQNGAFYLMSGADLVRNEEGEFKREYLRDAYCYRPGQGWSRIADLPQPRVASPNPAAPVGQSHLFVFSGDDGAHVYQDLREAHPGFPAAMFAYHTITDTWNTWGTVPRDPEAGVWPAVTAATTQWRGRIIVPNGEVKPGIRTPKVFAAEPIARQAGFKRLDYGALVVYLGALLLMGFYFARRGKSTEDFFLAGHRIPWWAAGLSIFGTQLSAITFMAIPAKTYATNWQYFMTNMGIVVIAPVIIIFFLPFYRRLNVTSAYEYLERRFNVVVRLFGSAAFVLMQIGRMGVILFLPAMALSAVTGFDVKLCILLMGVIATLYTVLGGIEAVVWTDVLQVFVLGGGALVALAVALSHSGGLGAAVTVAQADHKLDVFLLSWDYTAPALWVIVVGYLGLLTPYAADQAVIQRYLTTRDEKQAGRAIWTNALLTIPATLIFFSLGTALYVFYKANPALLGPAHKTDAILPWFVALQLPSGVSGLVIAGLFAASMSSLDSSMNSAATALTTDFLKRFHPGVNDHTWLRVARGLTLGLGVIGTGTALLMASSDIKSLWDQWNKILGLFGGSLAGLFVLGIFTRRANGAGAVVGVLASAGVLAVVQRFTSIHFFLWGTIGILTCVAVGYLCSLLLPSREEEQAGLTLYTMKRE